jgi:hypothetical protein
MSSKARLTKQVADVANALREPDQMDRGLPYNDASEVHHRG